jgi:triphosphoribosyl-dephospho-CoA synthetase
MQMSAEAWRPAAAAFDAALRMPPGINPGTTADLIATALYILLDDAVLRDRCGLSRFLDRLLDEP